MTAFIDTSVLYALLAVDSDEHADARDGFARIARQEPLVTHRYVEVETISLVQRRLGMAAVDRLVGELLPAVEIAAVRSEVHERALADLRAARSRSVSFVDQVSFAFMRDLGLRLALAIDDDFARQGFEVVP